MTDSPKEDPLQKDSPKKEFAKARAQIEKFITALEDAPTPAPSIPDNKHKNIRSSRVEIFSIPVAISLLSVLGFIACIGTKGRVDMPSLDPGFTQFSEQLRFIFLDCWVVLHSQAQIFFYIIFFASIAGFAGLIYKKFFWRWFVVSFFVLIIVNFISFLHLTGSVSQWGLENLHYPYIYYLITEGFLFILLIEFRGGHSVIADKSNDGEPASEKKYIVVCIDGTWNYPGQVDYGHTANTNVFRLWKSLKGQEDYSANPHANCCKIYTGDTSRGVNQIGLYYNGVGNKIENSELGQAFGGGFGFGAESIKERAYLDVARNYEPGDRILIFGFSRGAAIARLLASTIEHRGIPNSLWTLRLFNKHRPVWISNKKYSPEIEVLGCWDTVGSFGIPKPLLGINFQKINLFKNLEVSTSVKKAYHMLALDETRDAFEPSLMNQDPVYAWRIEEVWFAGNHSNVGGGYATHGLSDITLDFLLQRISSGYQSNMDDVGNEEWGLYLKAYQKKIISHHSKFEEDILIVSPDLDGILRHQTGPMYGHAPRQIPFGALIHNSVFKRMQSPICQYAPEAVFELGRKLNKIRQDIKKSVGVLSEQVGSTGSGNTPKIEGSINNTEKEDILNWIRALKIKRTPSHYNYEFRLSDELVNGPEMSVIDRLKEIEKYLP